MINIIVNGQSLSAECKRLASDSVDYLRCRFSFSSDWYGLTKTAQFTQNGKTINVLVENDTCPLPSEITAGDVEISVFGVIAGGTKRITTVPFTATVKSSGFVADGDDAIPPTPDLYSQLINRVEDAVDDIPDSLSQFTNDTGFVTEEALPKKVSELENDTGFVTEDALPKKVSELENDTGFVTEDALPKKVSELENDTGFVIEEALPKKVSQLENDAEYVKKTDIATPYDAGVVKVNASGGISINTANDTIYIAYASNNDIDGRTSIRPIVPANLEYAVRSVGDGYYVKSTDRAGIDRYGVVSVNYGFGVRANANGVLFVEMASNSLIDERTNEYNVIVPANLEYAVKSVGDGYYATVDQVGNIETALDGIIAMQEELIAQGDLEMDLLPDTSGGDAL